jgi:hypothetical protein
VSLKNQFKSDSSNYKNLAKKKNDTNGRLSHLPGWVPKSTKNLLTNTLKIIH